MNSNRQSGFTLIELMVSLAIFLVIAGAAFSLFGAHAPLFSRQQNLAGLNITLRNIVTQMELDVVNAGNGYYPGTDIASWPIGVTVNNSQPAGTCFNAANQTYTATCFDTLIVIAADAATPPTHPDPAVGNCSATDTGLTLLVDAPPAPIWAGTVAAYASLFHNGDQLLLIKSDGSQMATTTLTGDGVVSGTKVQLTHSATGASATDPLGITTYAATHASDPYANKIGNQFCVTDWVLKLSWTRYAVDATDPTDPKLTRQVSGSAPEVLAEQIIGFKVGASLWSAGDSGDAYDFKNFNYSDYDPSQVRSLRISLIGRTPPTSDTALATRNSFDGGRYQIQSMSIGVSPRNLSMNDQ